MNQSKQEGRLLGMTSEVIYRTLSLVMNEMKGLEWVLRF